MFELRGLQFLEGVSLSIRDSFSPWCHSCLPEWWALQTYQSSWDFSSVVSETRADGAHFPYLFAHAKCIFRIDWSAQPYITTYQRSLDTAYFSFHKSERALAPHPRLARHSIKNPLKACWNTSNSMCFLSYQCVWNAVGVPSSIHQLPFR